MIAVKNITLDNLQTAEIAILNEGVYLCLFGVDKIPPHLGIIAKGKYYSASAKGNRVGEPAMGIWRRIQQGRIPSLYIELSVENSESKLTSAFSLYPKLKQDQTCLLPIKDFLEESGCHVGNAQYVYELIPLLKELGLVKNIFSRFIEEDTFQLAIYTKEEITNRIVKLQETC